MEEKEIIYETVKLADDTIVIAIVNRIGEKLQLSIKDSTVAKVAEQFSKENITKVSLVNENGEYAVFNGYNASIIVADSEKDSIEVTLHAVIPDETRTMDDLQAQILETQTALAGMVELLSGDDEEDSATEEV